MHKYLIELMRYTEAGAPTNDYTYDNADTPQQLADKLTRYNKMRYTNEDGSVGGKMYKVTAKQGIYADIEDVAAFMEINGAIYRT